jgi:hypothetical protein
VGFRTFRLMSLLSFVAMLGCHGIAMWYSSKAQESQELVDTLDKNFDEAYARLLNERTSVNDKAAAAVLNERKAARSIVKSLRRKSQKYQEASFALLSLILATSLIMGSVSKKRGNRNAA